MGKIKCVGRGSDAADNAFTKLDDSLVQFVLLKFPVGSGTFKRNKFVYIHWIGPNCGIVKRGKWNAELPKALELFRTSTGLEVTDRASLTFDYVVESLKKVFVSDSGSFSVAAIRDEYNRRLEEERAKMAGEEAASEPGSPVRKRKLAVELGLNADSVLKAIQEDMGPLNWAIFEPAAPGSAPTLVEGGSNGLFELVDHLSDDKIYFGVVRVGFGRGRFRRTKRIFFHWAGDGVGVVKRAKSNERHEDMLKALGPVQAEVKLNGAEDRSVDAILDKVQKSFVVDNIKADAVKIKQDGADNAKAFTQEEYIAALLEEQDQNRDFYGEPEGFEAQSGPMEHDVEETLRLIHQDEGGLVWGVFQVA